MSENVSSELSATTKETKEERRNWGPRVGWKGLVEKRAPNSTELVPSSDLAFTCREPAWQVDRREQDRSPHSRVPHGKSPQQGFLFRVT